MIDLNQKLSNNFTLHEFVVSKTADKHHISNTPTLLAIKNLKDLCVNILQPFRDYLGEPITVNSGFRSIQLNKLVNGVQNSNHLCLGNSAAADIVCKEMPFEQFKEKFMEFLQVSGVKYDEVIVEKSGSSRWIHVAWKNSAGKQRMKNLIINVK